MRSEEVERATLWRCFSVKGMRKLVKEETKLKKKLCVCVFCVREMTIKNLKFVEGNDQVNIRNKDKLDN